LPHFAGLRGFPNASYDSVGRLQQVTKGGVVVGSWTYDGNGNRLSDGTTAAAYDAQDRQQSFGAVTFVHDANGNRLSRTEGASVTHYSFDGMGGLQSVTLPDGTLLEYVLDGLQRRVAKKRNGVVERRWLYDGQIRVVAEVDGAGNVSRFVYGTFGHSPDYMVRGGVTYRFVHDSLGSVRFVVNSSSGAVAQKLDYDAWGNVLADSSPGFQSFGFAGGVRDADTGLAHFGFRDYDSLVGRWTAKDPIRFRGGDGNLYAYVFNRPAFLVDPDGRRVLAIGVGAAGQLIFGGEVAWYGVYDSDGNFGWAFTGGGRAGFDVTASAGLVGSYYPGVETIQGIGGMGVGVTADLLAVSIGWTGSVSCASQANAWSCSQSDCWSMKNGVSGGVGLGLSLGVTTEATNTKVVPLGNFKRIWERVTSLFN
jgi:RHS repeat-associated protein